MTGNRSTTIFCNFHSFLLLMVLPSCLLAGCHRAPSTMEWLPLESPASDRGKAPQPGLEGAAPLSQGGIAPGGSLISGEGGKLPAVRSLVISAQDVLDTVASSPGDYDLRLQAAAYFVQSTRYAEARNQLAAAAGLRPGDPLPWVSLGDVQMMEDQPGEAMKSYQKALVLAPGNDLAQAGIAQALEHQHKPEEASRTLEQALKRNPKSVALAMALGNVYVFLSKPRLAEPVLKSVVMEDPSNADAHHLLGIAYARDFHVKLALEEEQAATAINPELADAWANIGLHLVTLGRYTEARKALQTAIRLAPEAAWNYTTLGNSYALDRSDPKNADRAIDLYHKALGLDSKNLKALHALATALERRDQSADRQEAARILESIVRLRPADREALYQLAKAYRLQGRTAEAATALARFQKLARQDPSHL